MKLGEYLNAINHTKETLLDTDDESVEKEYTPYVINRCLSYFTDTIFHVNEMNRYSNIDNDQTQLFRKLYEGMYVNLIKQSIPQSVLVLAEYQYKAAFVADHEINMTACLTELMMHCEFK